MHFLETYPYLIAALILFLLAMLSFGVLCRHWKLLFLSGLFALPSAFLSCEFIPAYWNPRVLFHFITSLEDLLFSVSVGVISMFAALLPYANRVKFRINFTVMLKRYLLISAGATAAWVVLRTVFFGDPVFVMPLALVFIVALGIVLVAVRRDLVVFALTSGIAFAAFYCCVLLTVRFIDVSLYDNWNRNTQLPFYIYEIPTFELLWALIYGTVWPLYVAFLCDLRMQQAPMHSTRGGSARKGASDGLET